MKNKKIVVSNCCKTSIYVIPASLNMPTTHFCSKCSKECKPVFKTVVEEIKKVSN